MKMRCELPNFKRCCLCIPLRYGILIFGYLNLFFSVFVLIMSVQGEFKIQARSHRWFVYRGVAMYTHIWFPYLIYALEVVFNGLLLIGAHWKHSSIIRAYYYYGLMTSMAAFLTFICVHHFHSWYAWYPDYTEICVALSGLGLQAYLLLLIRSELIKQRYQRGEFRYVNRTAEVVVVDPSPPGNREDFI